MRFTRTPDGLVQPDPGRVRGGRGAYLCPGETCLAEALRKNRWGQVFRAPSVLRPETVEGVRQVLAAAQGGEVVGRQRFQMVAGGASESMARESVEGGS